MKLFIKSKSLDIWQVVELGDNQVTSSDGGIKSVNAMTDKEKATMQCNESAKLYLICALSRKEYDKVSGCNTAKEIWDTLAVAHEGTSQVKEAKISMLVHQYELFKMAEGESIESMFSRFQTIIGSLKSLGKTYENQDHVRKILRSLPKRWRPKVTAIQEAKDLSKLQLDELLGSLKTHELELDAEESPKKTFTALKAKSETSSRKEKKKSAHYESEQGSDESCNTEDELSLISQQFRRMLKRRQGSQNNSKSGRRQYEEKRKEDEVTCFNCKKPGHYKADCPDLKKSSKYEKKGSNNYQSSRKGRIMMATWEDLSSDEEAQSSEEASKSQEANLALMAKLSEASSGSDSDREVKSKSESDLLMDAYTKTYDELMKLKKKYDLIKEKLHRCESDLTCALNEKEVFHIELKEYVNACKIKDYEIKFYKDEIERLHLKVAERSQTPPYEKLVAASQVGSKGLGYNPKDKGKGVLIVKNPSLESNNKKEMQLASKFCKAGVSFENEMKDVCKPVHAENKIVKQPKMKKHAYVRRSRNMYHKHVPAYPQGPKRIWVPKKFMLPFTDANRDAWRRGVGTRFWVLAAYDGEQFLVPRLYSQ